MHWVEIHFCLLLLSLLLLSPPSSTPKKKIGAAAASSAFPGPQREQLLLPIGTLLLFRTSCWKPLAWTSTLVPLCLPRLMCLCNKQFYSNYQLLGSQPDKYCLPPQKWTVISFFLPAFNNSSTKIPKLHTSIIFE